jgi:hypothetical protein
MANTSWRYADAFRPVRTHVLNSTKAFTKTSVRKLPTVGIEGCLGGSTTVVVIAHSESVSCELAVTLFFNLLYTHINCFLNKF